MNDSLLQYVRFFFLLVVVGFGVFIVMMFDVDFVVV